MQKCQPRGSVTCTLISMVASNGVVKVARGGKKVEIICERGRERKGVMQAFPTPFYNYVECKLRNTNLEYLNDIN